MQKDNGCQLTATASTQHTSSILGAINSLFAAGAAFGSITQGWTADWLGRKKGLFLSALLCVVGGALCAGSVNIPMLIICRFIQGLGLGQIICLAPLYISEISPPSKRGILLGMFIIGIGLGYSTCAWVGFGAHYATNETVQWRMPLALACVTPSLVCIGVFFIPESPRWLIWKGRNDEAWVIIERLHRNPNDATDFMARAEYTQILQQV